MDIPVDHERAIVSDYILPNLESDFTILYNVLLENMVHDLHGVLVVLEDDVLDALTWNYSGMSTFNVKIAYDLILGNREKEYDMSWVRELSCM